MNSTPQYKDRFHDQKWMKELSTLLPGVVICLVVGMAAKFVSENYGGPTILYALLMGMAFNYLSAEGRCVDGIQFSAKTVLRFGIALLGARITIEQLMSLGVTPIAIVLTAVPATILFGYCCGRWLNLGCSQSVLTGASVGICGASAALAVSAVLPQDKNAEKNLVFTVISVTALSTVAMIFYPMVVNMLGLDHAESGIFLGATIHDVAQVVGAGYMMSDDIGDVATFTKLLRVAMLVPVVVVVSVIVARQSAKHAGPVSSGFPLPGFLVSFVIIVILNSAGWVPPLVASSMVELSRWCLILAMVALGMKASFKELAAMGWRPMLLMVAETLFLAALVAIWLLTSR
jgi:uncharacterized integral membrane protein (TIGR00698 family)